MTDKISDKCCFLYLFLNDLSFNFVVGIKIKINIIMTNINARIAKSAIFPLLLLLHVLLRFSYTDDLQGINGITKTETVIEQAINEAEQIQLEHLNASIVVFLEK